MQKFNYGSVGSLKTFEIDNTDNAFLKAACDVVIDRGFEYVYEQPENESQCMYVHHDENGTCGAGCLIGTILAKMGVPLEWFANVRAEGKGANEVMGSLLFSDRICWAARQGQRTQDEHMTWGVALRTLLQNYQDYRDPSTEEVHDW